MYEVIFLIVLALVWIIFAVIQDLKKQEIANWLNFSLIIFALGFRFFYSLFSDSSDALGKFNFFYQGLIGLGIFFIIGNIFYYSRIFAGGDAKLMTALGPVLAFSEDFFVNLKIFALFLLVFLFAGGIFGLSVNFYLGLKNFKGVKKNFSEIFNKNKKTAYFVMLCGLIIISWGFVENLFFVIGIFVFVLPYLFFYTKSVDEVCMVKKIRSNLLREGDWLYRNVKIGNKLIKTSWDGLSKKQIADIKRKYKKVRIRQGVPFSPVFLISFLIIIYVYFNNSIRGFF